MQLIASRARSFLKAAPSALARDLYVEKVAEKIGASADTIRRALAGQAPRGQAPVSKPQPAKPAAPVSLAVVQLELVIVAHALRNPKLAEVLAQSGAVGEFIHAALREAADAVCSSTEGQDALHLHGQRGETNQGSHRKAENIR